MESTCEVSLFQYKTKGSLNILFILNHNWMVRLHDELIKHVCSFRQPKQWPKKIISGIQPTGVLHIGNYFGAVQRWVEMQESGDDVSFFIADLHSMTMPYVGFFINPSVSAALPEQAVLNCLRFSKCVTNFFFVTWSALMCWPSKMCIDF